jgi:hypothetical protein
MPEKFKPTIEKSKPYWQRIRELEAQLFPEFKDEDFCIDSPETNNFYFAPSVHFKEALITETDVENFKNDPKRKMLSVGAGPAYLERLLVNLGVNKDNIVLADKNPRDLPSDFKIKIFDMSGEWPEFEDGQFDLIIFPENPSINVNSDFGEERIQAFTSLFAKALQHLKPGGEIKITGNRNVEEITEKVEQELKKVGYNVTVQNFSHKGKNSLIIVKNETSLNTE